MRFPFVLMLPNSDSRALDQFVVAVWIGVGISAISAGFCSFWHEAQYAPALARTGRPRAYNLGGSRQTLLPGSDDIRNRASG